MHKAFVDAGAVFDREVSGKGASAGDWERIVLARTVDFPEGYEIPSDVNRNAVPWPDILADYSLMSTPRQGLERCVAILFRGKALSHQAGGPPV